MKIDYRHPKIDGWVSSSSSLGGPQDKHRGIAFGERARLQRKMLEALYKQDPMVGRIVDRIVDDGLRRGFELTDVKDAEGDKIDLDQEELESWLAKLQFFPRLRLAAKWSRLYGGALLVTPVVDLAEDAPKPEEPIRVNTNTALLPLSVIPAHRALPLDQDLGLFSPTYGVVLNYQIDGLAEAPVEVHHTRGIALEPVKLPIDTLQEENTGDFTGWGPSVIERIFDDLGRDGAASGHAIAMMYVASVLYLKLKNYRKDHDTKGGPEKIRTLLCEIRASLDAFGILGMDAEDEIGNLTLTVAGAHELVDLMRNRLAAASPMPREILYNESPAGLNAGELSGPQEIWHNTVEQWQEEEMTPVVDRVLELLFAMKGIPAVSWKVAWRPLAAKSEQTASELHAKNAEADTKYEAMGAITADEIRHERFVMGNMGEMEVAADPVAEPLEVQIPAPGATAPEPEMAPDAGTPADEAMNGAQAKSLVEIVTALNEGAITYQQATGVVGTVFPSLRGRETTVLGPEQAPAAAPGGPAPGPEGDGPSVLPEPGDAMAPRDIAARFNIPTNTINMLWRTGQIPYWGLGNHIRVSVAAVLAHATAHETPPPIVPPPPAVS